ncbi:non-heme dioxygenase in morphine synthesis N-terminal-domain-containing protein [Lactarius hengduanensis]|nr:non-heme dioxygenase in morphine synthesis N-terminal-domain-containing protein [Lactarius hengduanensis]
MGRSRSDYIQGLAFEPFYTTRSRTILCKRDTRAYDRKRTHTRPAFIQQLQSALINVGFLYLEHPPIPTALFDEVVAYLPRFFGLPQGRKEALRMANSPHFLGYFRPGVELTGGAADQREQFDFATPL